MSCPMWTSLSQSAKPSHFKPCFTGAWSSSPKWTFEDDILLREARALLRGLQVMVCAEHVRNARVLCLTDSMSCALAFERRRARNFVLLVQIRNLTSSVYVIILNFTSDGSQVKATAPMTFPDDMTRPSMLRVTSQITFLTVFSSHVQMNR